MTGRNHGPGGPYEIDPTVPHMARVYDYMLGGTNNFAVDRALAEHATAALGGIEVVRGDARANRAFLVDAVRYMAGEAGVRQFLDIGTGIPNDDNVHAVAQQTAADSRIVYVDYDPVVLAHANKLLDGTPTGSTAFVYGDLRDPAKILAKAADTLDLAAPVGLMLVGIFHYILDDDDPYGIMGRLVGALAPGSHVAVSHLASDIHPDQAAEMMRRHNEASPGEPAQFRSQAEVARFFDGLELLGPGVVSLDRWHRPDADPPPPLDRQIPTYAALGRRG